MVVLGLGISPVVVISGETILVEILGDLGSGQISLVVLLRLLPLFSELLNYTG